MRLRYFESRNFGDALNPYIFNQLLPGFFDNDPAIDFFGIGSILGFDMVATANRKIVFSSGFAYGYGTKPVVDASYDVVCVRGPLTAQALHLDPKLAVADGAILIRELVKERPQKRYPYSFMPHWESELKFDWKGFCEQSGIHYISPMQDYTAVFQQILESEVVIAEAMHAAIVSDALRVPWIPVKAYPGINDFKWQDWAASLELTYQPIRIPSMFHPTEFTVKLCNEKISSAIPDALYKVGLKGYGVYQSVSIIPHARKLITQIKNTTPYLSGDAVMSARVDQLLHLLDDVKKKYA
jgi:succinoglycan biosynthesis protein ExoV